MATSSRLAVSGLTVWAVVLLMLSKRLSAAYPWHCACDDIEEQDVKKIPYGVIESRPYREQTHRRCVKFANFTEGSRLTFYIRSINELKGYNALYMSVSNREPPPGYFFPDPLHVAVDLTGRRFMLSPDPSDSVCLQLRWPETSSSSYSYNIEYSVCSKPSDQSQWSEENGRMKQTCPKRQGFTTGPPYVQYSSCVRGDWDNKPLCAPVKMCPTLKGPTNGVVTYYHKDDQQKTENGSRAVYQCYNGFQLNSPQTDFTCMATAAEADWYPSTNMDYLDCVPLRAVAIRDREGTEPGKVSKDLLIIIIPTAAGAVLILCAVIAVTVTCWRKRRKNLPPPPMPPAHDPTVNLLYVGVTGGNSDYLEPRRRGHFLQMSDFDTRSQSGTYASIRSSQMATDLGQEPLLP